jgi:cell wall-associated NlpC family hydrolase
MRIPSSTGHKNFARAAVSVALVVAVIASASVIGPAQADQLSDKRAEARQVADKLAALDSRAMELNAQYEAANYELFLAQQRVSEAKVFLEQTNADLDRRRDDVKRYAVAAYLNGNDSPEFDALLTSDASSGVQMRSYLENLTGNRQDLVDSLNSAQLKAKEDQARLESAQSDADERAAEIEKTRIAAEAAAGEQRAVNSKVQGELAALVAEENARRAAAARAAAAAAAAQRAANSGGSNIGPIGNPPPPGQGASGAIEAAVSRKGAPYVWAASGPNSFDCSGLVMWAYGRVGVSLPHFSGAQYARSTRIGASQLAPGDLVFWGSSGSEHVAIYMGGDQIVHAFGSMRGVAVTNLNGWWKPPTGYGRLNY